VVIARDVERGSQILDGLEQLDGVHRMLPQDVPFLLVE
jgi:hypothetical protein